MDYRNGRPLLLASGVDHFGIQIALYLDQLIAETKINFKAPTSSKRNPVLY